jgi:hypothetical protein
VFIPHTRISKPDGPSQWYSRSEAEIQTETLPFTTIRPSTAAA